MSGSHGWETSDNVLAQTAGPGAQEGRTRRLIADLSGYCPTGAAVAARDFLSQSAGIASVDGRTTLFGRDLLHARRKDSRFCGVQGRKS